ncbi:MAG: sensor histidine kinase, partial [Clostridiales bacterium]|nr:sensor histidine kinase [Clostridiales bacterium]
MKLLGDYIKSRRGVLLFFALAAVLLGVSFALFHLPLRAVAYPCALALLLGLAALALDFRRVYKLHRELSQLETTAAELIGVLPAAASVPEADYQAIVQSLCRQSADAAAKAAADRADMLEYYTLWAHQIK